ncbi:MAG: hypothetical protein IIX63_05915 [Treponema sp.]|nr:hypothetical protein [Treponema sp.]
MELKGNPSTGYTWEAVLSSENIVEVSKDVKYLGAKGKSSADTELTPSRTATCSPW